MDDLFNFIVTDDELQIVSKKIRNHVIPISKWVYPRLKKTFKYYAKKDDLDSIKLIARHKLEYNSVCVKCACKYGTVRIVKYLSEFVHVTAFNPHAICSASEYGNLGVVKFLLTLPDTDSSAYNDYAFRNASRNGHLGIVKLLSLQKRSIRPLIVIMPSGLHLRKVI